MTPLAPLHKKPRRPRGLVARGKQWAQVHAEELTALSDQILDTRAGSPFVELLHEGAAQYASGELLDLTPPIVRRLSLTDAGRFGVFHPRTDRDAFVEALLGRPVPKRPRYQRERPLMRPRLRAPEELMDALGPVIPEAGGLSAAEQVVRGGERLAETIAHYAEDPALSGMAARLTRDNPQAFAETPLGEWLLQLQTDTIARDAAKPPFQWEFVILAEFAPGVAAGIAWWDPADFGARHHRAKVAAYLRHLFDYRVSPWNRWPELRKRREAAHLLVGRLPGETVAVLAERLRSTRSDDYVGEPLRVTVDRLYRINASLDRERKVFSY